MKSDQILKRHLKFEFAPFLISKEDYWGYLYYWRNGWIMGGRLSSFIWTLGLGILLSFIIVPFLSDASPWFNTQFLVAVIVGCIFLIWLFAQTKRLWHTLCFLLAFTIVLLSVWLWKYTPGVTLLLLYLALSHLYMLFKSSGEVRT